MRCGLCSAAREPATKTTALVARVQPSSPDGWIIEKELPLNNWSRLRQQQDFSQWFCGSTDHQG